MKALTLLFFLLTRLGYDSWCQQRAEDALVAFTKARDILKSDSSHTLGYAALCDSVAKLDLQLGKMEDCVAACREAVDILEALHEKGGLAYAANMYMLGVVYGSTRIPARPLQMRTPKRDATPKRKTCTNFPSACSKG